jgi:glycosyltransferase involved in cell wall biosynthesis
VRILVVTQHFWPSVGGAEVMLRRLSASWAKVGCQVVVLTQKHDRSALPMEKLDGFTVVRLNPLRLRVLGTIHFIASVRRQLSATEGSFDVVFVSMLKHAAYAAMTTKWTNPPPIVLRAEGAGPTGDMAWQDSARFGAKIRTACQRADAFIAPSPQVAEELRDRGYRPDAVHEIPNGVPIPEQPWRSDRVSEARKQLGLPNRPTIVYTGRLHADKGLNDLIDAVAPLTQTVGSFTLLLVGDGPERESLQRRASEKGIQEFVRFIGQVESVEPYLRASNMFVLPSYQEGLSVSLLEALALGMPCLASDIPANAGLVSTDLMQTFPIRKPSELGATIFMTLHSGMNPGVLAEQRRHIAERFSIDAAARRHLEVFKSLIKPK